MPWYVLQTITGGEEKLVEMIRRLVPKEFYGECFAVYHEQLWRRQQQTFVHVKRAFPGYVFVTSKEPEALFFCLKKLPAMVKMMADKDAFFLSLDPEEAAFLQQIMDEHRVIGLSYLETDGEGRILQVSGPLSSCTSQIVRCRFGKRYVIVRLKLLGKEKEVLLGIILKEDICQEIRYGKVEIPMQIPKNDERGKIPAKSEGRKDDILLYKDIEGYKRKKGKHDLKFSSGDVVVVAKGMFAGMPGMVYQADYSSVKIGIKFLGRRLEMEMPPEVLKKKGHSGGE